MRRREFLAAAAAGARVRRAAIEGTYLQLWAAHKEWGEARWVELSGYFAALGLKRIVVQWSGWDGIDYGDVVRRMLEMAGARGMRVTVGLWHESEWWKRVEAGPEGAIAGLAERARRRVEELRGVVRGRRAFAGWYLPEEFDDGHWVGRERVLAGVLKEVRRATGRLAVSGFSNGVVEVGRLAALWRGVRGEVDEVLFQDGVGAGKLSVEAWGMRGAELGRALGKRLTVVVETFEGSGEGAGFAARPAGVERIERQLEAAWRAGRRGAVAFSVPEYMTPLGGEAARGLYEEWLRRRG